MGEGVRSSMTRAGAAEYRLLWSLSVALFYRICDSKCNVVFTDIVGFARESKPEDSFRETLRLYETDVDDKRSDVWVARMPRQ